MCDLYKKIFLCFCFFKIVELYSPYPEAIDGSKIASIKFDQIENNNNSFCFEENYRIEFKFFKNNITNGIDSYFYSGKIEEKILSGYQYKYYIVKPGILFKSNFIKLEEIKPIKEDILLGSDLFLKYNHCLNYVFYLYDDVKIKYRLFYSENKYIFP